jgi:hypothetical protein
MPAKNWVPNAAPCAIRAAKAAMTAPKNPVQPIHKVALEPVILTTKHTARMATRVEANPKDNAVPPVAVKKGGKVVRPAVMATPAEAVPMYVAPREIPIAHRAAKAVVKIARG